MAKRTAKALQGNLFRTGSEAMNLLRSADELQSTQAKRIKYKDGTVGVKIKSTAIVTSIPEQEADVIIESINKAISDAAVSLCHRAKDIMDKLIPAAE